MKFVISFLAIAMFFYTANAADDASAVYVVISKRLFYELSAAVFEDELDTFLEDIKPLLKTGNASLGIPKLEPYQLKYYNISTAEGDTSVEGDITDVNIDGLSDYTINTAKFRYAHLQVKTNLTWPNITLNSMYRINAEINKWGYIPVYGKGDVKLEATNFTIASTMKMGLKAGKIFVREMTTSFHLGKINLLASGIYDSKGVSQLANAIVSSQLPHFIERYQEMASARITPILMNSINQHLAELSFEDFLNIVG